MEKFSPGPKNRYFSARYFCARKGIYWLLQIGRSCADLAKQRFLLDQARQLPGPPEL
mgnify:CR=1 FL=1